MTTNETKLNVAGPDCSSAGSRELIPTGFYRTRRRARNYLNDRSKASNLLAKASAKASGSRSSLAGVWDDLMLLFRFLGTWITGSYRDVSVNTMLLVITAILYFVMPLDVIPDFTLGIGFMDDVALIMFVLHSIKAELDKFVSWEKANEIPK
jgi:uncharacterized membrane protein YkvA (DUF1232 family)